MLFYARIAQRRKRCSIRACRVRVRVRVCVRVYVGVVFCLMLLARIEILRVKVERGDDEFTSCTHRSGAPPTKAPT